MCFIIYLLSSNDQNKADIRNPLRYLLMNRSRFCGLEAVD